ncbi:MAG TPA: glycosyltransferase family 1 protein [Rhodocyclaceae bacterium]|nr:glycosyltransferase family 1 protein [Rhodocyclaceae bacterium]
MDGKLSDASSPATPLHIALVTETYPPEVNGVALTLARLVTGLRQRSHDVQLIRPRQTKLEAPARGPGLTEVLTPGLPIPGYPGLRFGLPARRALHRLWSQNPPDIVHVATEGPLGAAAVSAARALNLPISSGFHTNFQAYSHHYRLGWLRGLVTRYMRRFHNRTDLTLVPTVEMARELAADGYRNVDVLARGVDTQLFSPRRRSQELRQSWGATENTLVVAYVGRLAPEKNLSLVTEAFDAIASRQPGARLLFVGDGPSLTFLRQRHRRHIFAGMRLGEELAAHYASADLFLFPSLTETFGNVVPEALASGLAVVAFDRAAAADLIEDGSNGRTVSADDRQAFVMAAVNLANDPARLATLRARASASVAPLTWECIHDCFAHKLSAVLTTQRAQSKSAVTQRRPSTPPACDRFCGGDPP